MCPRKKVAVLGATGSVGQQFVRLLHDHPWFEIDTLAASERSAGSTYGEAVHWLFPEPIPPEIAAMPVRSIDDHIASTIVFSALPTEHARVVEPELAKNGHAVVTNASALRMDRAVPLVVPEINPDHLGLLEHRGQGSGFIVANPNCATVGLVMALHPLGQTYGITEVDVTTLQAVSGAGYPGVASLDIMGNVVPLIPGEEDKLEEEPRKILGRLSGERIEEYPVRISAQCTRVPVIDGHLLSVSVKLDKMANLNQVSEVISEFRGDTRAVFLPSAPARPLHLFDGGPWPQPRLHAELGDGMTVSLGRLRPCKVLDYRFVVLVHNTIRGAAGAAVLNAELLVDSGLV